MTNYIIARAPNKFGGNQEDYIKRSDEAIQKGLYLVGNCVKEGKDLKDLFPLIVDLFAKTRHTIAEAHNTPKANLFGKKRFEEGIDCYAFTCLYKPEYQDYNQKFLNVLTTILEGKIPSKGEVKEKNFKLESEMLGRKCSFEIELLTMQDFKQRGWNPEIFSAEKARINLSDLSEKLNLVNAIPGDGHALNEEELSLVRNYKESYRLFKNQYPELYKASTMCAIFRNIDTWFPSPKSEDEINSKNIYNRKSLYILSKVRIEINNKLYALSEYVTWTYRDFEMDPVKRMQNSFVTIIHQDQFLINETLKECAHIFEKAVKWDKKTEDVKTLTNRVALIRYLFAHAMPTVRGSAAIGEWIEKLIYKYHAFNKFRHNGAKLGDLEALTALMWSEFQKVYDSTIDLA